MAQDGGFDGSTAPATATAPLPRSRFVWVGIAALLVVVVLAVWGLGGFEQRQDRFTRVPAGTALTVGPFELSFAAATVQYVEDKKIYEVVVTGSGRTSEDTTVAPDTGDRGFAYAQDPISRDVQAVDRYDFGESGNIFLTPRAFTPGLASVPIRARFTFGSIGGDSIRLVLFDQEFSNVNVFGEGDPTWHNDRNGHDLVLPLRSLPPRKY